MILTTGYTDRKKTDGRLNGVVREYYAYVLTARSRALEKLTGSQLVKTLPAFYEN